MGLTTAPASLRSANEKLALHSLTMPLRWPALITALYTALTVALLWPLVSRIGTAVPDTLGDPLLNAWTLRWVQHALVTSPTHLYDGNMFAPNALSLAFSELLLPQAIMAWPVWLISRDPLVAYNVTVLATYPLCAIAMYALCRGLGANRGASFLAGLCFAFAPFRLDNNAHLQVLSMQWMPLAILAILRYMQKPSRWRFAAVTGTVILAALSSVYYTMMFGTGLVIFLVIEGIRQRRLYRTRVVIGLLAALTVAGLIVAALDVPYLIMRRDYHVTRTLDEAYDDAAHAASYMTVTPGSVVWRHVLPTSGAEHAALFPGAMVIAFAVVGLRTARRPWMTGLLGLGLVSLVLSFGPTWGAKGAGFPLPYRLLYRHVVGYQGIRGPDRFAALVLMALCVLAAMGVTSLWQRICVRRPTAARYAAAFALLVGLLAIADCATRLLPTVPVSRSATTLAPYRWLAARHDSGIIAEFPVEDTQFETAFYSTYHWHPVLWGHSGFVPEATYQLGGWFVGREDYPRPPDLDLLADAGVRTLVIHRSSYPPDLLRSFSEKLVEHSENVRFLATVGDCDLYALFPDPSALPLRAVATFKSNPAGNLDKLPGQLTIENPGTDARMLYTHGVLDLVAEVRAADGATVSRQSLNITLPAIIPVGTATVPLSVDLPRKPGTYSVLLRATNVPFLRDEPTTVNVISLTTLPHLSLDNRTVRSPALYEPGEIVAMWVTTKGGKTVPLDNTTALPDGTIRVTIPPLPPNATQVVAHGKASGVELWVAPP